MYLASRHYGLGSVFKAVSSVMCWWYDMTEATEARVASASRCTKCHVIYTGRIKYIKLYITCHFFLLSGSLIFARNISALKQTSWILRAYKEEETKETLSLSDVMGSLMAH